MRGREGFHWFPRFSLVSTGKGMEASTQLGKLASKENQISKVKNWKGACWYQALALASVTRDEAGCVQTAVQL